MESGSKTLRMQKSGVDVSERGIEEAKIKRLPDVGASLQMSFNGNVVIFQALAVFNVLHMFVGGLVGASLHARGMKYYVGDGFARCSGYIDSVRMSARHADFPTMMSGVTRGFMAQSIKILFGWTLLAALFFAILMLLWDIPMVRRQVKHIPDWPMVEMGVLRGFRRHQRLKELRRQRRLSQV